MAVKWTIPFASLNGTTYRVDIYDPDYTGNAETLTGASDVFVTDEDNNDDFFHPVRTQTGTLRVVDTDGTLLERIVPENNTHRFVRLVETASGRAMWQGFLSCEVYQQQYTACTQVLSISVNSVLAAMDSISLDETEAPTFVGVEKTIANAMDKVETKAGVSVFDYVYFPRANASILTKYFNMSTFFDKQEQCNEDSVKYIVKGISLKEMLERLCQFMGWTLRECGKSLYFASPDDTLGLLRASYAGLKNEANPSTFSQIGYTAVNFAALTWTGDQHTKSISQGAKSVEVIANLSDFSMDMELPECPVGNLEEFYKEMFGKEGETFGGGYDWYLLANTNATSHSNLVFNFQRGNVRINTGAFSAVSGGSTNLPTTIEAVEEHMSISDTPSLSGYTSGTSSVVIHSGAFLCKEEIKKAEQVKPTAHDTTDGLHCVFFPGTLGAVGANAFNPLVTMDSVICTFVNEGYLRISADVSTFCMLKHGTVLVDTELDSGMTAKFALMLKFGNKYWHSTNGWQTEKCWFEVEMEGNELKGNWNKKMTISETSGYLIPITEAMFGKIELSIMTMLNYYNSSSSSVVNTPTEMTFTEISVDNVQNKNNRRIERAENHYFRLLSGNFSEEKQIDFQMGSDLNNLPSPSTPMEDYTTPITKITYVKDAAGNTEIRRPEIDLLNRAARYYTKPRRMIDIQIEHPAGADIARQRITGEGRTFTPLSESRSWAEDSSNIRCFEMPAADEE